MNVLAIVHGDIVGPALFGDVIAARGDDLEVWRPADAAAPRRPIADYGAVLVLGGVMDTHEEDRHPWLRAEDAILKELIERETPLLGVCLGAQLLAKAAQAPVEAAVAPEIGWHEIELTSEARDDPLFKAMPARFHAFEWHHRAFGTPHDAVELARSRHCSQAFRLRRWAWGAQFHPEVTSSQIGTWLSQGFPTPVPPHLIARETSRRIDAWNRLGEALCRRFLELADSARPRRS